MLRAKLLVVILTAGLAIGASAQGPLDSGPVTIGGPRVADLQPRVGAMALAIDGIDMTPVKGTPFCAVITTEHTQPFADGNRIHTSDSSSLCRDSEGRTRREAGLNLMGAAPQSGTKLITIVDPVGGYHYMLDSTDKTARRMPLPPTNNAGAKGIGQAAGMSLKTDHVMYMREGGGPGQDVVFGKVFVNKTDAASDGPEPTTENLGDQTIDGIHATGTRITTTIPAGKMGNEQPIVVTSERWYSPELKATVLTKHNDPWSGELKTQFTTVNTSEPDSSLFAVPSDYKIVDDKAGPFTIKLQAPAPPAQ